MPTTSRESHLVLYRRTVNSSPLHYLIASLPAKIRRLYDIANILTSLDLIRKVHVTEIRGRKPAFKYVGPDIDNNDELHNMCKYFFNSNLFF